MVRRKGAGAHGHTAAIRRVFALSRGENQKSIAKQPQIGPICGCFFSLFEIFNPSYSQVNPALDMRSYILRLLRPGLLVGKRQAVNPLGENVQLKGDIVFEEPLCKDKRVFDVNRFIVKGVPDKSRGV